MKLFTVLAALLVAGPAFAQSTLPNKLDCHNGHYDDDRGFSVVVENGAVDLNFWESYLHASAGDIVVSGNTIAIVEKQLKGEAEGDFYTEKTSALLVYDAEANKMTATIYLDGHLSRTAEVLACTVE